MYKEFVVTKNIRKIYNPSHKIYDLPEAIDNTEIIAEMEIEVDVTLATQRSRISSESSSRSPFPMFASLFQQAICLLRRNACSLKNYTPLGFKNPPHNETGSFDTVEKSARPTQPPTDHCSLITVSSSASTGSLYNSSVWERGVRAGGEEQA